MLVLFYYIPVIIVAIEMIKELTTKPDENNREDYIAAFAGTFIPVFNIYIAYQVLVEHFKKDK